VQAEGAQHTITCESPNMCRVGQNHIHGTRCGLYTEDLAGESPIIRSYTVHMYGSVHNPNHVWFLAKYIHLVQLVHLVHLDPAKYFIWANEAIIQMNDSFGSFGSFG